MTKLGLFLIVPFMGLAACDPNGGDTDATPCDRALAALATAQTLYAATYEAFQEGDTTSSALKTAKQLLDVATVAVPSVCPVPPPPARPLPV
jgi:hypothetical protein